MATVGNSTFYHSATAPHQRDGHFREVMSRNYWDHSFHPLKEQMPTPSYVGMRAEAKEAQRQPWALLARARPVGLVDAAVSFDRCEPVASAGSASPSPHKRHGVSAGYEPLDIAARTPTRRLRGAASLGMLRLEDDASSVGSRSLSVGSTRSSSGASSTRHRSRKMAGYSPTTLGPPAAPMHSLCGPNMSPVHRMPSFARIYGS
eukprot:TRINITY_DN17572_c0_g1_i1.p1 TRINITY_DN17572_c0_g1~~TRINITY_DN17572_c0_g1_i1.p1  ORF type:complete len:204 (-),score=29.36 TRINITY_DN17572_c0_g1_i1:23-634(-)